jgi:predicted lipoprotein with Yx(FWY)xxD motif
MGKPRGSRPRRVGGAVVLATVVAALGASGFLAAGSIARSAGQSHATVNVRKTSLGRVLVNSKGHTLYVFMKDKHGKSACSGSCAKFWPPLLVHGKRTIGPGVRRSLLSVTRRTDGKRQLRYRNHPLYTFALDKHAGQTNGEGNLAFGARWYAISAAGRAVKKAHPPTTTTTQTTTTTGYP